MNRLFRHPGILLLVFSILALSSAPVLAADLPDLQPASIAVTTLYPRVDNTVTAVIQNNTNVAVESFAVRLEIDGQAVASSTGNYISGNEDAYYWPLSVNFSWEPETAGNYTLKVIIDPDNAVAEADETNNEITRAVDVIDLSDITVKIRIEGKTSTI